MSLAGGRWEKSKERYKIEAKNSELKHRHGYDVAKSSGLIGMELQGDLIVLIHAKKRRYNSYFEL
ncbi:hypothetical protein CN345_06565 [Bacillus thuringiensis]|nr:hypothetical protein CN345_06565 [Bacillus thuringiensis]PGY58797.1 hypothetical protein COE09_10175 [Bacillus thuringiensis]